MESSAGLQRRQCHLYLPKYSDKVCWSPTENHVFIGSLFQEGMLPFQGQRQGRGADGANTVIVGIPFLSMSKYLFLFLNFITYVQNYIFVIILQSL